MTSRTNLEVALDWASANVRVLPCRAADGPGGKAKTPLIPAWNRNATTDPDTIRGWWALWPDAMPAIVTEGLIVIDCDQRPGIDGIAAFAEFTSAYGVNIDGAMQVDTPSGGRHYYWRDDDAATIGNRRGLLPEGIDVRSQGRGYVIAEGAVRGDGGVYRRVSGPDVRRHGRDALPSVPASLMATWLDQPAAIAPPLQPDAAVHVPLVLDVDGDLDDLDLSGVKVRRMALDPSHLPIVRGEGFISDLEAELARTPEGRRGRTLNNIGYRLGRKVGAGAIDFDSAREALMRACHANGLVAKDGLRQVEAAIGRALQDGRANPLPLRNRPLSVEGPASLTPHPDETDPSPWRLWGEAPPTPPDWLVHGLIPRVGVSQLVGVSGVGKSAFALALAAHVISGAPFFGRSVAATGGVLWLAAEGEGEIESRLQALHVEGRIAKQAPFAFTWEVPRLAAPSSEAQLRGLVQQGLARIQESHQVAPCLLVIDTMAAAAGWVDENNSAEAQQVFSRLRTLAHMFGLAVLLIDHYGKAGPERGTRGSSAKDGAADARISLTPGKGDYTARLDKVRAGPKCDIGQYEMKSVRIDDGTGEEVTAVCMVPIESHSITTPTSPGLQRIVEIVATLEQEGKAVTKEAVRDRYLAAGHAAGSFGRDYRRAAEEGLVPIEDLRRSAKEAG